ncbi:hypothetical protein [Bosea sp. (in: a-proteobacteria)]|uniref:hypothetical protein n=1 Tax=Bosea sp. (in: a-proteobacteria) TaxID=1871050 RepID=UPI00261D5BE3|nr:hypothetical protein [Bosea sp. (in: a-proteobacteria)]MCO5090199.1 hypothetical protein [Bosea sp. (in: a-proteobacteria)]
MAREDERGHNALPFRLMDETRAVLRGVQPSYTDPAGTAAQTAQDRVLTGEGM